VRVIAGFGLLNHDKTEEITKELHIPQTKEFIEQCRRNWKGRVDTMRCDRAPKHLKISTKKKKKKNVRKTSVIMEEFGFEISVTDLNSPSRQMPGDYLKLSHDRFLQHPFDAIWSVLVTTSLNKQSGGSVKLATHFCLVPGLIMHGAVPPLPHVFMAWSSIN
jgi:hypothetical protein